MEMDNNHRSSKLHARTRSRTATAFSSPALLSPSEEIYSEIFAGFHGGASSVPVVDLPPVDETESLLDFRFFDYSEVFGGFEGIDYAVPFHELFRQSKGGYASSSDDAWTPVETECLSEEWDGSSYSSKHKSFGNESNQQSVDDGKQFSMSFQQKRQLKGVSTTGHLAPVHVVPGYAVVIDQIATSQNIELQNLQLVADFDDGKLIKRGRLEEKHSDKLAPCREIIEQEKADVPNCSNEMYVTISEVNLRTKPNDIPPPSRPPPIFDARYGNPSQATSSIRACTSMNFRRSVSGNDSPMFVDVEVDGRFSAADFASSIKVSVKKSQVTLKMIKENLENKNVCAKDETERNASVRKSGNSLDNSQYPSKKESSRTSNSSQSSPDVIRQNHLLSSSDRRKSKQSWSLEDSSEARSSGEWSEAPEFIELVRSVKNKNHKQDNGENSLVQNGIIDVCKEEGRVLEYGNKIQERVSITNNKLEDHVKSSEAMSEVASPDEKCKEVLVSLQTTHQCKEVERKAYEDDQQPEDDIFIDTMNNEHEIKKEFSKFKQKVKFDKERAEDARVRLKNSFVATEDDQRVRKTCEIRLIDHNEQAHSGILKDGQIKQQNERLRNIYMEETQKPCFEVAFEDEENFKNQNKANEKEQKEKELIETKKTSRKTFEMEENERREKEEEYVAKLMEASENEADDMLKVALEEVNKTIIMEEVERAERGLEMKNNAERFLDQESLDELSRFKDMMSEHIVEKEPKTIKKILRDPNMMTDSRRNSYLTPDADINTEATDHRIRKTEKIKEETIKRLNLVCELNQDNVGSAQEVIIVPGKKPTYKQTSDEGRMIAEYTTGTDTNELLSATHENTALPNRTSMSGNSSGEASLHEDEIGVRINHKVSHMGLDSKSLPEKVKVGKVTMLENVQAQTKADSHDEVDISKDKFAQKTDKAIANNNRSVSDGRKQTYNLSQQNKTGQTVGGKENCRNDGIASEERVKLERERRAREMELERLRETEEEWEREREREKDRVAFESVTRNVLDAASAGLRERASVNKDNVGRARQNDLGNARERLEESCLEADVKSNSDKILMEAKTRQDKSAVKRAYTESHECADRSVSFSTATDPSITVYNDGGLEGESAKRYKARLERQQRTAERAAKALAEKNTRDVIAQREEAEKHRLAESLDAKVKRWANGKQENLRALLSTMHYILGADSGWQPVPLTTIITSVAVKKAYRKATLCVHPDKLQQRRATIQQKYICEKVFNLLKEAWNKFNSEER